MAATRPMPNGSAEAQAAVGNAVPFVLWFNFVAGFGYVMAGVGLWLNRRWGFGAAVALAIATAGVAMAFYVHVHGGGAYEPRTVGALGLRLVFWSVVAGLAWRCRSCGAAGRSPSSDRGSWRSP